MSEQLDLRDAEIAKLKQERLWTEQELDVYRLASERAIYDAQQFDASLYLNTDRGVEDVMRRVLARLAEYEGVNKRWHSFETVQALAKERDALQAEANRYYANWQAEKSIIHNVESGTQWATSNVKPDDRSATLEAARDKLSAECDAPHCQSAILRAERDLWRKRANVLLEIAKAATDIVDATYVIRNSGSYIVSGVEFERLQRAVETVKQMSEEEGK